jgi:predicted transcriptional regulator
MKEHVAEIVAAYVGKNRVEAGELPALIVSVSQALASLGQAPAPEVPAPAVPIRRSVNPAYITCLDCGARVTLLRRHLANAHNLTPANYSERWNLPSDYPLVAPGYTARRSEWAKATGLGRMGAAGQPGFGAPGTGA